ncbi:collagen alpha-1(I) chain-like isoform X1 [Pseudophryne corroboree]|uniref:collagen alpha-1(I) chain-like isoform X1 n=1 Tax=Pseudophryne corroboree TaxID=495146 RepID=UPI003081F87D
MSGLRNPPSRPARSAGLPARLLDSPDVPPGRGSPAAADAVSVRETRAVRGRARPPARAPPRVSSPSPSPLRSAAGDGAAGAAMETRAVRGRARPPARAPPRASSPSPSPLQSAAGDGAPGSRRSLRRPARDGVLPSLAPPLLTAGGRAGHVGRGRSSRPAARRLSPLPNTAASVNGRVGGRAADGLLPARADNMAHSRGAHMRHTPSVPLPPPPVRSAPSRVGVGRRPRSAPAGGALSITDSAGPVVRGRPAPARGVPARPTSPFAVGPGASGPSRTPALASGSAAARGRAPPGRQRAGSRLPANHPTRGRRAQADHDPAPTPRIHFSTADASAVSSQSDVGLLPSSGDDSPVADARVGRQSRGRQSIRGLAQPDGGAMIPDSEGSSGSLLPTGGLRTARRAHDARRRSVLTSPAPATAPLVDASVLSAICAAVVSAVAPLLSSVPGGLGRPTASLADSIAQSLIPLLSTGATTPPFAPLPVAAGPEAVQGNNVSFVSPATVVGSAMESAGVSTSRSVAGGADGVPSRAGHPPGMEALAHRSLAPATFAAYRAAWERWCRFIRERGQCGKTSHDLLLDYIWVLYSDGISRASVNRVLAGISYFLQLRGEADFTKSFFLRRVLKGWARATPPLPDTRQPITGALLRRILGSLPSICFSGYEVRLFRAAFTMAFHGAFRVGELVSVSRASVSPMLEAHVVIRPDGLWCKIQRSKTDVAGRGQWVRMGPARARGICPVSAARAYSSIRPPTPTGWLVHCDGAPLTRYQFRSVLGRCILYLGLSPADYGTHSFRIGAASAAAAAGWSEVEVRALGRWRSGAVRRYIRPFPPSAPL